MEEPNAAVAEDNRATRQAPTTTNQQPPAGSASRERQVCAVQTVRMVHVEAGCA